MNKSHIRRISDKYQKKSEQEYIFGAKACSLYKRIATQIAENIDVYANGSYKTEEDLIDAINELLADSEVPTDERDPLFEEAKSLIVSSKIASAGFLQYSLNIGRNRANRIIAQLEAAGIVSPQKDDDTPREVLCTEAAR
ncbi:MAG: hypothetical protein J6X89_07050 [Bacteroidales bacterium]|nr:hypothetical protein [Bacteroidales bacterium]